MGKLELHRLRPGMVLDGHVRGRNGRLLINAGTVLTEDDLRIMRIWGVIEADVQGETKEQAQRSELASYDPEMVKQARAILRKRFRFNDQDNEAVRELFSLCLNRTTAILASGKAPKVPVATPDLADDPLHPLPTIDPQVLIHDDLRFGSMPAVFNKLMEVVGDARSSSADVAEVVTHDPDLSARLLRLVNSPFYGLGAVVDTVSRAVTIVGTNQLISLAMGITVINSFEGIPNSFIDMQAFWRHSISCGLGARFLASHLRLPTSERFFVGGLLHDLGRLLMYLLLPDYAHRALALAVARDQLLLDTEKEVMSLDHTELSGALLEQWRFPAHLAHMVRHHHTPLKSSDPLDATVICVADAITNAMEIGSSGERFVPLLDSETWKMLDLPASVITQVASHIDKQTEDILDFLKAPRT